MNFIYIIFLILGIYFILYLASTFFINNCYFENYLMITILFTAIATTIAVIMMYFITKFMNMTIFSYYVIID